MKGRVGVRIGVKGIYYVNLQIRIVHILDHNGLWLVGLFWAGSEGIKVKTWLSYMWLIRKFPKPKQNTWLTCTRALKLQQVKIVCPEREGEEKKLTIS